MPSRCQRHIPICGGRRGMTGDGLLGSRFACAFSVMESPARPCDDTASVGWTFGPVLHLLLSFFRWHKPGFLCLLSQGLLGWWALRLERNPRGTARRCTAYLLGVCLAVCQPAWCAPLRGADGLSRVVWLEALENCRERGFCPVAPSSLGIGFEMAHFFFMFAGLCAMLHRRKMRRRPIRFECVTSFLSLPLIAFHPVGLSLHLCKGPFGYLGAYFLPFARFCAPCFDGVCIDFPLHLGRFQQHGWLRCATLLLFAIFRG